MFAIKVYFSNKFEGCVKLCRSCSARIGYVPLNIHHNVIVCQYASKSVKSSKEAVMPQNLLKDLYSASQQQENGNIYDKKPFKMKCVPGKDYLWCLCGRSKTQPLCDGTHRSPYLKIKQRPIKFQVTEERDYWLCNCKQTSNRPFCDGTHKREDIQAAVK